jgi:Glycosyl transferase family 2
MKISVISRWFHEEFFAPYFLSHYSWADEIVIILEKTETDKSAEIIARYPNARIQYCDFGGMINDHLQSDMMSDLAASMTTDWVIRADGDELIFPAGGVDPREALAHADGNVITTLFRWIYRHADDADLDPSKPALMQRRHGGPYTIYPGMGATFTKPSIVRPEARIRWTPGEQRYAPNPLIQISSVWFNGVHWQMVDVDEAVRRLLSAEARLSAENRANNWGVRRFTEAQIRAFCSEHAHDPQVI